MKTAFVLAGYDTHETATGNDLVPLKDGLRQRGYHVIAVDISWLRKLPTEYARQFVNLYSKQKSENNIIIGNSFGAVVTFLTAKLLSPDSIYLCSLSPFFKEDRSKLPASYGIRYFGSRRLEDLWSYSAIDIAKDLSGSQTKTYVLYGEKENQTSPEIVARSKQTAKHIKNSELHEIPGAPHDMSDPAYTSAILDLT